MWVRGINFWKDHWIPNFSNIYISIPTHVPQFQKVFDLINPVSRKWNLSIIENLVPQSDIDNISKIPQGLSLSQDQSIWHFDKRGEFIVKLAYTHPQALPLGSNNRSFSWRKLWNLLIPQKIKHFI